MSWKEFLKPDKRRLIIFLSLLLIIIILFVLGSFFYINLKNIEWFDIFTFLPVVIALRSNDILLLIIGFISIPIYWYIISCIIVWFYDNVKKPKKLIGLEDSSYDKMISKIKNSRHITIEQFFKPYRKKIITFIILFIFIYSFVPFIHVNVMYGPHDYRVYRGIFITNLELAYTGIIPCFFDIIRGYNCGQQFSFYDIMTELEPSNDIYLLHILIYFIITAVLSYFISCLIFWVNIYYKIIKNHSLGLR